MDPKNCSFCKENIEHCGGPYDGCPKCDCVPYSKSHSPKDEFPWNVGDGDWVEYRMVGHVPHCSKCENGIWTQSIEEEMPWELRKFYENIKEASEKINMQFTVTRSIEVYEGRDVAYIYNAEFVQEL